MRVFDINSIDWAEAARHGISKRMLQQYGYLDLLLEGGSTPDIPLQLEFDGVVLNMDGSLTLRENDLGIAYFEVLGVGWH